MDGQGRGVHRNGVLRAHFFVHILTAGCFCPAAHSRYSTVLMMVLRTGSRLSGTAQRVQHERAFYLKSLGISRHPLFKAGLSCPPGP